jgi:hypothetical protein
LVSQLIRELPKKTRALACVALPAGVGAAVLLFVVSSTGAGKANPETLRWAEGAPNCTLRVSDDGHTYYGMSLEDLDITLGIDRQELEKIPHREIPMITAFLSFQYHGSERAFVRREQFALEFLRHRRLAQPALDPDGMLKLLQSDVDDLTDEVERHQIGKHPEQKEKKEAELQARLKDYTEMMDFISTHALHSTVLSSTNPSVSGWVFFSAQNKWIGALKRPEQFMLRLPAGKLWVEFPFELPPKARNMELRRRPGN